MTANVWFITGSSRGLGRKIAEHVLASGDTVVATARTPEALADLAAAHPDSLIVERLDVTDDAGIERAVAAGLARFGRIDVLVNNAGYAGLSAVEDTSLDDFRAQLDTNLVGTVAVTKAVLPTMREQGSGRIINISSVGSRVATPGLAAYQAAKWAVSGFTEVLAREVSPLGIHVTAVEPGGMPTDWAGSSMNIPVPSAPYEPAVGPVIQALQSGHAPLADLDKAARAVLRVAALEQPPTRLLLGSDAIAAAAGYTEDLAASDAHWEELTRSSDRDDATTADWDPLGTEATKPLAVVRRFVEEVVNGGNLAALDELWAQDMEWHGGSLGDIIGLPAYKTFVAANASGAFTGMKLTIHDTVVSGDHVVLRFTNSGTQTGPFMGAPAKGTHAQWLGIGIYTVRHGKITTAWFGEDILGMMLQLGIVQLGGGLEATDGNA